MSLLAQSASRMTSYVREADVDTEKEALTDFLSKYLSPDANSKRYEWLYRQNPAGKARIWTAHNSDNQEMIGISAAFPKKMYHDGKIAHGYVLGDFCIHPEHRSLGPAIALQRATLEAVSKEGPGFVLDFPSTSMLAIYKRLGIGVTMSMPRYAKPLRANRQMQARIPSRAAASTLAAAANLALRAGDIQWKRDSRWTIAEETQPCGEEFTIADQDWSSSLKNCGARSAEYMNWRFLQHPQQRYHLLTARKDAKLCGFLIYQISEEDGTVVDLYAEENSVYKALLHETIAIMRREHIHTISAPFLATHACGELLEDCGFQPRESTPVILLALPWLANQQAAPTGGDWYLTHGDRES
jgi:GNAT superfamily N-acetyltransferase